MNRRILPSFLALLVMALAVAPAWAQVQNRTIYGIPEGWSVTANGQPVTVSGDSAIVPEGAAVLLIPPLPAKPKVSNVTVEEVIRDPLAVPLTLEALTAGNIQVNMSGTLTSGMKYSVNGGAKNLITETTTIDVAAGDKVQFYGNGTSTQSYGNDPTVKLQGTAQTKVYGNIMSLLDEDNFATLTALPNSQNVFYGLFQNNANLTDASGLLLPATTLREHCYNSMFRGCSSLTAAPALPATTLAEACYYQMFRDCSSLTSAPALPAPALAKNCYNAMFRVCSSLIAAPVLPATTLAEGCYYAMFYGCSNLNSVTCLATSNSANQCTTDWLQNVAATGTFYADPATNWTTNSSSGIPTGWTRIDPRAIVPLTMEALTAGNIEVNISGNLSTGMKYSVNGGAKNLINTTTTIDVAAGDKVQFYGNGTSTQAYGYSPIVSLLGTAQTKVYGNIMSLLDEDNFATLTALPSQTYVFRRLFSGNANLTDASGLLLPATTLANYCYNQMFQNCSTLTAAPALPATTLATNCYREMFYGCSSLTAAPALPATTLANLCYYSMFQGCYSLTAAPALPATTLVLSCYYNMFSGCSSLTAAPALPATTLADNCYRQMFQNCSNLNSVTCLATSNSANYCTTNWLDGVAATGTFYADPATNWTTNSASGIPTGWTRKDARLIIPLTLEALTAGNILVYMNGTLTTGMKYSVNGGAKTLINNTTTIDVAAGDKVQFYGNGTSTQVYGDNPGVTLLGTAQTKAYGNIMSLLDEDNFATLTALPSQNSVFSGLFYGNANLTDASGLLLPATTLANYCYKAMFYGCSSLTAAPALPATTLANQCYRQMFYGCSSLTAAPALPATTLANYCYASMFQNCSTLTAAPALPATTLADYCYSYMFQNCSTLTAAPALPATTLANYCYTYMFHGCSSLTAAPVLPATTLANYCYYKMFQVCSNLNSVTCLATDISASQCTNNWLNGVAATGTFITPASTGWGNGASGIPSGWTRQTP